MVAELVDLVWGVMIVLMTAKRGGESAIYSKIGMRLIEDEVVCCRLQGVGIDLLASPRVT